MSEERYFAARTEAEFESERLGHLQKMCNPITFRRLQAVGVKPGWRCLEVGAGEGAVARWLAEQVGSGGQVVATDVNTRFLRNLNLPNVEVRTHHIVDDELERGHYDLVHCRAVLGHLLDYGQALARMVAAVRPGGWICIEEGDYGAWSAVDWESAAGERFTRAFRAALAGLHKKGIMNPYFGRLTPALLGGRAFEPHEENPMIGFRGAARYFHPAYEEGFALECAALKRVRETMGLTNLKVMVPFCRRLDEARQVLAAMARHGLARGEQGLEVYVMCEIPNNVLLIDEFAELFDGFSIGSNDLTQLTLGVDRDSAIVASSFDEQDPGMLKMLKLAVEGARRNHRHCGICGQAPSDHIEVARYLVGLGIDSISLTADRVLRTMQAVREIEAAQGRAPRGMSGTAGPSAGADAAG